MRNHPNLFPGVEAVAGKLFDYCRANDWAGWDPYDALNSGLFDALPALRTRLPQLVMTQLLKRSPVNLRGVLGIPPTQNPKGIALFLSAVLQAPELCAVDSGRGGHRDSDRGGGVALELAERLVALRSPEPKYWCWGYSFAWQTRTIVVPRHAPNLVCTTFVAGALFDLYEARRQPEHLDMAVSATEYILHELYWSEGAEVAGFCYPLPGLRGQVHNANFLAAALLARAFRHTGREEFLSPALRAARYSAGRQRADGSWVYGEAPTQQWVDNFHTGYNLCGLQTLARDLGSGEFDAVIERGFAFYKANFFRADGAAKYFHDRAYPLDIHSVAQSVITLLAFQRLDGDSLRVASEVYRWAVKHMWDERGYFYYRVMRFGKVRTPYMRWSEAWMLLALATILREARTADAPEQGMDLHSTKSAVEVG